MVQRFLITTADERTWPKDRPVLFLGEWCRLYNRKNSWEHLDAEVVPYHWDDRKKLHRDYLYLQSLYETLLVELSEQMNLQLSVNHTLRYWRILIGPWLGTFMQMLFDRWKMIQRAVTDYNITGVRVLESPPDKIVPNDMQCFERLRVTDAWNETIYGQLLKYWTAIPVEKVYTTVQVRSPSTQQILPRYGRLKHRLARAMSTILQMISSEKEAFFISSYLPLKQDLLLQMRLGQVPKLWLTYPSPTTAVDWTKRSWRMDLAGGKDFSSIIKAMIPKHIPLLYLEGYKNLEAFCGKLPWPKKPILIFTSSSESADDVFKAWAAEKIETGTPLVIGQHGGNYGIGRWEFTEDHQCKISDLYLSWGWSDKKRPKIKPVCNLKMIGQHGFWNPLGYALMVEMTMPRYSYRMYSVPVAGQWLDYFNEQCRFVNALPNEIRKCLLVRLYGEDYGWCQKSRWHECFPDLHLDVGRVPIKSLINKSRLYISTYNATTFLESMAMNIPTIIFWNPNYWELRDSALPYFERLIAAGIFHKTPESAARQVARIWDDVSDWWGSKLVQTVCTEFCYRYSRMPESPLINLKQILYRFSEAAET